MRVINNLNIPFLKVVPLVRNHLTMAIRITWKVNGRSYSITLKDSYLMLPASLRSLIIAFGVTNKGFFLLSFISLIHSKKYL
jgi:hypothetical protein